MMGDKEEQKTEEQKKDWQIALELAIQFHKDVPQSARFVTRDDDIVATAKKFFKFSSTPK